MAVVMGASLVLLAYELRVYGVHVEALLPRRLDGYALWFGLLVAHLVIMLPAQIVSAWRDPDTVSFYRREVAAQQAQAAAARARIAGLVSHVIGFLGRRPWQARNRER
jgi:hypothetical protein